jgi:hypothetical protein
MGGWRPWRRHGQGGPGGYLVPTIVCLLLLAGITLMGLYYRRNPPDCTPKPGSTWSPCW